MITFTQQHRPIAPAYARGGDVFDLDGTAFDFSDLPDGATLPRGAINSSFVVGPVTRQGGAIHMTLIKATGYGHPGDDPIIADGIPEGATPGEIDWSQMVTAAQKETEQAQVAKNARAAAYRAEADPIFFKHQRGEATEQEWLDKIEEIRARYPYPEK